MGPSMSKTLIQRGTVITMDPATSPYITADVLIEDDRILAVGADLQAPAASLVDARDMIVMPGLVNAHAHLWQTAIRTLGGNWAGTDYFQYVHAKLAPRHTPEDTHVAEYIGALNQLNGGTTTVFDWCHNNTTPEHTDAAVDGLARSGMRAVFGHGTVKPTQRPGEPHFSEIPHPRSEIERLRKGRFAADGSRLSLAMCILGPDYSTLDVCRTDFLMARELDLLSSAHVWGRANRLVADGYRRMAAEGLLGPRHNVVHANYIADDEIKTLVDAGASITATPPAEIRSHARPPLIGRVAQAGGRPTIGNDSELWATGEMLETMRLCLHGQRFLDNQDLERRLEAGDPALNDFIQKNLKTIGTGGGLIEQTSVTAMDALRWATLNNAWALGLDHEIGSLTPGKKADLIMLRRSDLNLAPAHDPVCAVVLFANAGNVDTVFVDGQCLKKDGRLIDAGGGIAPAVAELTERGRRLMQEAGLAAESN